MIYSIIQILNDLFLPVWFPSIYPNQNKTLYLRFFIHLVVKSNTVPFNFRAMETSIGIFRGQEDVNISDNFPKANNLPPIVALEICRERMVIINIHISFFLKIVINFN